MTRPSPDSVDIEKILDDVYQLGRTDALLDTNDYAELKPNILTLFRTTLQEIVPEKERYKYLPKNLDNGRNQEIIGHRMGWNGAIDTINANIKDILGEDKS